MARDPENQTVRVPIRDPTWEARRYLEAEQGERREALCDHRAVLLLEVAILWEGEFEAKSSQDASVCVRLARKDGVERVEPQPNEG